MTNTNGFAAAFKSKRILIAGGLGFVGSNLAHRLVDCGSDITLVDSLVPEYGGNMFNIRDIRDRVSVNLSDVRDTRGMADLIRGQDILFNLVGQTSHMDSMQEPLADLESNCRAQLALLETCRETNPALKIVFSSTRQVYGRPRYLPVDESHPLDPVDINGINKLSGEMYHLLYNRVYGMPVSVLRLTNTIGPRMRIKDARQTFLGIWVRRLLEGDPIEVWGGEQLRDFTDIDDCVDALLLAASRETACGKIYNLGGIQTISLKSLAKELIRIRGGGRLDLRKFPEARRKIDVGDYCADFRRIRDDLGWRPTVTLETSLRRILAYYGRHLDEYV